MAWWRKIEDLLLGDGPGTPAHATRDLRHIPVRTARVVISSGISIGQALAIPEQVVITFPPEHEALMRRREVLNALSEQINLELASELVKFKSRQQTTHGHSAAVGNTQVEVIFQRGPTFSVDVRWKGASDEDSAASVEPGSRDREYATVPRRAEKVMPSDLTVPDVTIRESSEETSPLAVVAKAGDDIVGRATVSSTLISIGRQVSCVLPIPHSFVKVSRLALQVEAGGGSHVKISVKNLNGAWLENSDSNVEVLKYPSGRDLELHLGDRLHLTRGRDVTVWIESTTLFPSADN